MTNTPQAIVAYCTMTRITRQAAHLMPDSAFCEGGRAYPELALAAMGRAKPRAEGIFAPMSDSTTATPPISDHVLSGTEGPSRPGASR